MGGNEVDLLLYPTAGQEALALRRLESEAIRRAVAAAQTRQARAWAAGALELRRRRFSRLPASAAAYERGTELKEGLARYIEVEAIGFASPLFPPKEFPAAAIRARGYASGCAMALLLDRLHPTWKGELEEKDDVSLDALLTRAVAGTRPRDLPTEQEKRAWRRAAADVAHLRTRRSVLRREFLEAPGWTVVVESNQPLSPTGFDPLNVEPLSDAEVLHTRWLKLASDAGSLEVLDRPCLTEAAGAHPLFQGVRRVTITGVTEEPRIEETQDAVKLSAKGLQLRFRRAWLTRLGRTLTITVEDESNPSLQSAPE